METEFQSGEASPVQLNNRTSVGILQDRCRQWIRANFDADAWMPSYLFADDPPPDELKPLHVVLMGDFLSQILCYDKWPHRPLYLWVLSSSVKQVLVDLLGFPEKSVGVIPRYDLFPASTKLVPFPNGDRPWTMVFGGRIVPPKHLEFAVRTVSYLQNEFGQKVQLKCFGTFANQARLNLQQGVVSNYEESIQKLCESLPFKFKPEFHPPKKNDEWLTGENNVCISFSSYHMEDFGVSVAQAQELGLPCIVTDWGGHRDVVGENVLKFPIHYFGTASENHWIQDGRAFALASEIAKFQQVQKKLAQQLSPGNLGKPHPIVVDTLKTCVNQLEDVYTKDVHGLFKDRDWDFILNNDLGRKFFERYNRHFGNQEENLNRTLVLETDQKKSHITDSSIEMTWAASQTHEHRVSFFTLPTAESETQELPDLTQIENLVILQADLETHDYLKKIRTNVAASPRLIFYTSELIANAFFPAFFLDFLDLFRSGDQFVVANSGDKKILEGCLKNVGIHVAQFPIHQLFQRPFFRAQTFQLIHNVEPDLVTLYYMGHVREDSNLHSLYLAMRLLAAHHKDRKIRLDIFPIEESHSPRNIENSCADLDYLKYLEALSIETRIRVRVLWKTLPLRELIFLQKNVSRVFFSASLRPDEFLAAPARYAIASGDSAILSDWGAHQDLAANFPDQVRAVSVRKSPLGPYISPIDLFHALEELTIQPAEKKRVSDLSSFQTGIREQREMVSSRSMSEIELTPLFTDILEKRKRKCLESFAYGRPTKSNLLFDSYQDPAAEFFFSSYGMKSVPDENKYQSILIAPWVTLTSQPPLIIANDPIRGQVNMLRPLGERNKVPFFRFNHDQIATGKVTETESRWLKQMGLAFEFNPDALGKL